MAKRFRSRRRQIYRLFAYSSRRRALLAGLANWNRNQLARIIAAMVVLWIVGAVGIHLAEQDVNPAFKTWIESFWNVWVLLFSGLESPPQTTMGRFMAMVLLTAGV